MILIPITNLNKRQLTDAVWALEFAKQRATKSQVWDNELKAEIKAQIKALISATDYTQTEHYQAYDDTTLVGTVCIGYVEANGKKRLVLKCMMVRPRYRGKGIQQQMIDYLNTFVDGWSIFEDEQEKYKEYLDANGYTDVVHNEKDHEVYFLKPE